MTHRAYDPFARGPHPVGVRTETWTDDVRERPLVVEIWYPAAARHRGEDLDPATQDSFEAVWTSGSEPAERPRQAARRDAEPVAGGPLILFSHGFAGFRRETTFIPTHLASHGYVVVAADHLGTTAREIDESLAAAGDGPIEDASTRDTMASDRKGDVVFLIAEATRRGLADEDAVGVTGSSLGGFTTYVSPAVEPRVRAIAPMCPAGGPGPIAPDGDGLRDALDFAWSEGVATLHLAAERDTWLPLYGHLDLFGRAPGPARLVVLRNADHNHFVDDIETSHGWYIDFTKVLAEADPAGPWQALSERIRPYDELVAAAATYPLWSGLVLAHFDANLRDLDAARGFWTRDITVDAVALGAEIVTVAR